MSGTHISEGLLGTYTAWIRLWDKSDIKHRASDQRIPTKSGIACCAVVEDYMIPFAAYTAKETLNAFQWVGQPPKLSLPVEAS